MGTTGSSLTIWLKSLEGLQLSPKKEEQIFHPQTISPWVFEHKNPCNFKRDPSIFPFCVLTVQITSFHHTYHSFDLPEALYCPLSDEQLAGPRAHGSPPVLPNSIGQLFNLLAWVNSPGETWIPLVQLSNQRAYCELHWGGGGGGWCRVVEESCAFACYTFGNFCSISTFWGVIKYMHNIKLIILATFKATKQWH